MAKILDSTPSRGPETVPESQGFSLISNQKLVAIYIAMVKCRMLQQRAATLFQQGKLDADFHASSGLEACAAAVGIDLQPEDTLSIAPGDWFAAFVKGMPVEALFRTLAPRVNGHPPAAGDDAQQRNILLSHSRDQLEMVHQRALAARASKKAAIVAAFLPPVPAAPNHWQKLMSAAAAKRLPVVFVHPVLDGGKAQPASATGKTRMPQALFHGVPTIAVDSADPVALYRVAYEAITRARQRRGATLLECAAIPPGAIPDADPTQPHDPVCAMETYLKRKGIQPENYSRQVVAEFTRDLDLATRFLDH